MDFNTDSIVTAKAKNLLPITIMERYEGLIDAWEFYLQKDEMDRRAEHTIKARLNSLYLKLHNQINDLLDEEQFVKFTTLVESKKVLDWKEATKIICKFLYTIGLTKLPMTKSYDSTDIEAENEAFGL